MSVKEYKQIAESKLQGNLNKFALLYFVQAIIIVAFSGSVLGIASFLVIGPIQLGCAGIVLNYSRGKDFKITDLFDGFDRFVSAFVLKLICNIFIFLWFLLLVVPGIMAAYSYIMSFYILRDNPRLKPNEARNRSIAIMHGHKWQLFCLHLSYIGWILLSILTLGILLFWVLPKVELATVEFYENLKK